LPLHSWDRGAEALLTRHVARVVASGHGVVQQPLPRPVLDVVKGRGHQRLGALFSGPASHAGRHCGHIHRGGELVIPQEKVVRGEVGVRAVLLGPVSALPVVRDVGLFVHRHREQGVALLHAYVPHLDHDVQLLVQVRPRGVVCRVLIRHHPPVQGIRAKRRLKLEALPFAALQFARLDEVCWVIRTRLAQVTEKEPVQFILVVRLVTGDLVCNH